MLVVEGVSRKFGAVAAVQDVSITIIAGESYALLGPDGAGKTTLMRLLCGALLPDGGNVSVGGVDVRAEPERARRMLGYMPQQFSLYPRLSVDENIRFFSELYGVDSRSLFVEELLESSRLSPFRSRQSQQLSGGMKQKLALICAILHRPPLLLLDEPTTGVDPVSRRDFWAILYRLLSDGTTLVTSTPYMDESERCHRVGLLSEGRLIAEASPSSLRQAIQGRVVEIECQDPPSTSRELQRLPEVIAVQVFTDRVRVLTEGSDVGGLERALAPTGKPAPTMKPVAPSMEDAFIANVSAARRG
ncbi:ABC transporter ATP-binding protein [Candidatus Poribacteria bacterium]|nr:ABC transporter ATP-binding protein [Candidatus Poribacteria bacterium]